VYVRCNDQVSPVVIGGASVPNYSSRFKTFAAGQMISSMTADEVVIDEVTAETCGYAKSSDAVGKMIEFLTTRTEANANDKPAEKGTDENAEEGFGFFGLPLEDSQSAPSELNRWKKATHRRCPRARKARRRRTRRPGWSNDERAHVRAAPHRSRVVSQASQSNE